LTAKPPLQLRTSQCEAWLESSCRWKKVEKSGEKLEAFFVVDCLSCKNSRRMSTFNIVAAVCSDARNSRQLDLLNWTFAGLDARSFCNNMSLPQWAKFALVVNLAPRGEFCHLGEMFIPCSLHGWTHSSG
jgi:hypothetical protein